jgi:hypothetical protein
VGTRTNGNLDHTHNEQGTGVVLFVLGKVWHENRGMKMKSRKDILAPIFLPIPRQWESDKLSNKHCQPRMALYWYFMAGKVDRTSVVRSKQMASGLIWYGKNTGMRKPS